HIVPWSDTKDHRPENLIVLCANCHTRAHVEKWTISTLQRYKRSPCALQANQPIPTSAHQKAIVDLILAAPPEQLTETDRLRLASIVAAYAGVRFTDVSVISVTSTNSSRVRLELPSSAKKLLLSRFEQRDPLLLEFFMEFGPDVLLRIEDGTNHP